MKTIATIIAAVLLPLASFAGDKVVLQNPLIVAVTREEAKNLNQMIRDGDKEGMTAEYQQGLLTVIPPGETVYVTDIGFLDGIDTLRYHGQTVYAPNHEVHVLIYGNQ